MGGRTCRVGVMNEQANKLPYGEQDDNGFVDKRRSERTAMYDVKKLWERHHEILGLALLGTPNKDIAEKLGVTAATVSNCLNGPLGKEKLAEMRGERDEEYKALNKAVSDLTEKALQVYHGLLEVEKGTTPTKLQKETADTVILDLAGHRAPTKIDSRHVSVTATAGEIEDFKSRGRAAIEESGLIPEGEIESTEETE